MFNCVGDEHLFQLGARDWSTMLHIRHNCLQSHYCIFVLK
uniref:Uncharacterized protein n=1 Tax=Arundo donax TaxID=35708 RepID=A0A0A8YFE4_ARUDO